MLFPTPEKGKNGDPDLEAPKVQQDAISHPSIQRSSQERQLGSIHPRLVETLSALGYVERPRYLLKQELLPHTPVFGAGYIDLLNGLNAFNSGETRVSKVFALQPCFRPFDVGPLRDEARKHLSLFRMLGAISCGHEVRPEALLANLIEIVTVQFGLQPSRLYLTVPSSTCEFEHETNACKEVAYRFGLKDRQMISLGDEENLWMLRLKRAESDKPWAYQGSQRSAPEKFAQGLQARVVGPKYELFYVNRDGAGFEHSIELGNVLTPKRMELASGEILTNTIGEFTVGIDRLYLIQSGQDDFRHVMPYNDECLMIEGRCGVSAGFPILDRIRSFVGLMSDGFEPNALEPGMQLRVLAREINSLISGSEDIAEILCALVQSTAFNLPVEYKERSVYIAGKLSDELMLARKRKVI